MISTSIDKHPERNVIRVELRQNCVLGEMTDAVRRSIISGGSSLDIRKNAIASGMITLRRAGLMNAMRAVTTLDEIMRHTVGEDAEPTEIKKTDAEVEAEAAAKPAVAAAAE